MIGLEVESGLQRHRARTERRFRLPKARVRNVVRDARRIEVQVVKQVEGVRTKLNCRMFPQPLHIRQSEALAYGAI